MTCKLLIYNVLSYVKKYCVKKYNPKNRLVTLFFISLLPKMKL